MIASKCDARLIIHFTRRSSICHYLSRPVPSRGRRRKIAVRFVSRPFASSSFFLEMTTTTTKTTTTTISFVIYSFLCLFRKMKKGRGKKKKQQVVVHQYNVPIPATPWRRPDGTVNCTVSVYIIIFIIWSAALSTDVESRLNFFKKKKREKRDSSSGRFHTDLRPNSHGSSSSNFLKNKRKGTKKKQRKLGGKKTKKKKKFYLFKKRKKKVAGSSLNNR